MHDDHHRIRRRRRRRAYGELSFQPTRRMAVSQTGGWHWFFPHVSFFSLSVGQRDMDNPRLVFDLVWVIAIHPRYLRHKRRCANAMHRMLCTAGVGNVQESSLSGMMEVLEYVSNCLLVEYGFATPWYTCDRFDTYHHPIHVRALNLESSRERYPRHPNSRWESTEYSNGPSRNSRGGFTPPHVVSDPLSIS